MVTSFVRYTSWIALSKRDAFVHWTLERLAAGNQSHAAGAFVDDGRSHGILQIAFACDSPPELIKPARPM